MLTLTDQILESPPIILVAGGKLENPEENLWKHACTGLATIFNQPWGENGITVLRDKLMWARWFTCAVWQGADYLICCMLVQHYAKLEIINHPHPSEPQFGAFFSHLHSHHLLINIESTCRIPVLVWLYTKRKVTAACLMPGWLLWVAGRQHVSCQGEMLQVSRKEFIPQLL